MTEEANLKGSNTALNL
jgi:hypothetical protein